MSPTCVPLFAFGLRPDSDAISPIKSDALISKFFATWLTAVANAGSSVHSMSPWNPPPSPDVDVSTLSPSKPNNLKSGARKPPSFLAPFSSVNDADLRSAANADCGIPNICASPLVMGLNIDASTPLNGPAAWTTALIASDI